MKSIVLKNGIRLVCYQMDNVHSVTLSVCFKGAAQEETEENCGIAHMTEHLFFRRANELKQKELYRLAEEVGSDLRGTTYKEMIRFCMKVRPRFLERSLYILKQLLADFEWTQEEFERERQIVLRELDEKYFNISDIADSAVYKNTSAVLPILGTYKSLMNMSVSDVNEFRAQVCSSYNATVIVTGKISDSEVKVIENALEDLPPSNCVKVCAETKVLKGGRKPDVVLKAMEWDNAEIRVCFDVPEGITEQELMLLNSVLGGGVGSRLQLELRENAGITSDIRSEVVSRCGIFKIYIDYTVLKDEIYKSLEMIKTILKEMKKGITQDEFNRNIVFFADNFMFDLDDAERMNENISWHILYNPDLEYSVKGILETYQSITKENLKRCAQQIFVPENTTIVIVGDTGNVTKREVKMMFAEKM